MRRAILLCFFLIPFAPAAAQQKNPSPARFPMNAPPQLQVVQDVHKDAEAIILTRQDKQMQPIQEKAIQNRNGMPTEITYTRYVPVTTTMEVFVPLKSVSIYDGTGKKLTIEQALQNLKQGDVILESTDGFPVDPIYLRPIRPETIVLVSTNPRPRLGPIEIDPPDEILPFQGPLPKRLP